MCDLARLKVKYGLGDGAKYSPSPDCRKCHGTGEWRSRDGTERFCMCLYVAPDTLELAQSTLAAAAKKILAGMKGGDA